MIHESFFTQELSITSAQQTFTGSKWNLGVNKKKLLLLLPDENISLPDPLSIIFHVIFSGLEEAITWEGLLRFHWTAYVLIPGWMQKKRKQNVLTLLKKSKYDFRFCILYFFQPSSIVFSSIKISIGSLKEMKKPFQHWQNVTILQYLCCFRRRKRRK